MAFKALSLKEGNFLKPITLIGRVLNFRAHLSIFSCSVFWSKSHSATFAWWLPERFGKNVNCFINSVRRGHIRFNLNCATEKISLWRACFQQPRIQDPGSFIKWTKKERTTKSVEIQKSGRKTEDDGGKTQPPVNKYCQRACKYLTFSYREWFYQSCIENDTISQREWYYLIISGTYLSSSFTYYMWRNIKWEGRIWNHPNAIRCWTGEG